MQSRHILITNYVFGFQIIKSFVDGDNLGIGEENRNMQGGTFQCRFRRLNQRNPPDLLLIALFPKEIRITHCRHGLPTTVIDDVYYWYLEECLWQMLKSIIEFCLVHLAVSEQVGGHLWLGVQDVNATVQSLKEFVLQGLWQFAVEFGGQIPHFVESGIVHVFQLVSVVGVLFYHHSSSSFTAISSIPQCPARLSAVLLAFRRWFCKWPRLWLSFNSRSISSMLGNVPLNSAG